MPQPLPRPTQVKCELARRDFARFAQDAWPQVDPSPLIWDWPQQAICEHLTWISLGEIRFLLINISPRMAKSTLCAVLWPAWEWIDHPELQFLTGSYAIQLAARDALKARRMVMSPWYRQRYGDRFHLLADESAKRQYANDHGGRRVITSTDATATGEGGNRLILDDPHNVRETESDTQRMGVHDFWDNTLASRLNRQNVDSWMVIGQRTHGDDLFAHIRETEDMKDVVDLVLPNEYDPTRRCVTINRRGKKRWRDPRTEAGELMCVDRIDAKAVKRLRKLMRGNYNLQYQQDDSADDGGHILKRKFWRKWPGNEAPECFEILMSSDTALGDKQTNDYYASTYWGLFEHPDTHRKSAILFGGWRDKGPYHEMRKRYKESYENLDPDTNLIEKKVSGFMLIQDFRRMRMRVTPVKLDHGGRVKIDMRERAELAAPVLESGLVWYIDKPICNDVIEECAKVPGGKNDDLATTTCMALVWLRRRIELTTWEETSGDGSVRLFKKRKTAIYG